MVATRKKSHLVSAPDETATTTTTTTDSDSVEEANNQLHARSSGLSRLSVPRASTSLAPEVRVWPLCLAIAIEKSRRARPAIMVGAATLHTGVTYHLQESDAELLPSALVLSPLVVFVLVEAATLMAAFCILLPQTMAQAYRDDVNTRFKVADSAVLSALPPAVARFAVGSGIAWRRVVLAVVRDGALFMTLYLLCVALSVGGDLVTGDAFDSSEHSTASSELNDEHGGVIREQEMDGGISVRNVV